MKAGSQKNPKNDSAKSPKGPPSPLKLFSLQLLIRLLFSVLIFFAFLYLSLPHLAQLIIPKIAANHGLPGLSLHVDGFGLKQTAASLIEINDGPGEGIQLAKLAIGYSPEKIIHGQLDQITLIGLNTLIDLRGDTVGVAGLPEIFTKKNGPVENNEGALPAKLPLKFAKFEINRSTCIIKSAEKTFHLPYDLTIQPNSENNKIYDASLTFYFEGHKVGLYSQIDLPENHFELMVNTQRFPLYHPNGIIPINSDLAVSALIDLLGKVSGTIKPFAPTFDFHLYLNNFSAQNRTISLSSDQIESDSSTPIQITLNGDADNIKAGLSHLYVGNPPLMIEDLKLLMIPADTLEGSGSFNILSAPNNEATLSGLSEVKAQNNFTFQLQQDDWKFSSEISISPDTLDGKEIALSVNQLKLNFPPLNSLFITASGNKKEAQANYRTALPSASIIIPAADASNYKANLKDLSLNGSLKLTGIATDMQMDNSFDLAVGRFDLKTPLLKLNSSVSFKGQALFATKNRETPLKLSGFLKLANGKFVTAAPPIYSADFSANLPIAYPFDQGQKSKGSFLLEKLKKDEIDLGKIDGDISLLDNKYKLQANYKNSSLPGLEAIIAADIDIQDISAPTVKLDLSLPEFQFDSNKLQKFYDLGNFSVDGKLTGEAKITASVFGLRGNSHFAITDTNLINEFDDLAITGLNLGIEFPDISQIKSSSSKLVFAKAQFGDITFDGGKAAFQIESPESLLIERSSVKWSKGNIDLMATRIKKTTEQQDFLLYCNGLNLAEMLVQLGVSNVSGKGTVNGKIPAILKDGKIMFDDGFLYSTPGTGGNININNSDILLAGIPKNTIQYGQLDFAGEALKNFYYNWVTLDLQSRGEDAILTMKLDGKPSKPLPFKYDTDVGTFVRMESYGKGVNYPIILDVNFHLPLNKMINYGNSLRDLFN